MAAKEVQSTQASGRKLIDICGITPDKKELSSKLFAHQKLCIPITANEEVPIARGGEPNWVGDAFYPAQDPARSAPAAERHIRRQQSSSSTTRQPVGGGGGCCGGQSKAELMLA